MEEGQIVRDIVDSLYGNDVLFEDQDADTIKQINKEKDEKYDEIFRQINSVCERVENDLKNVLGNEGAELRDIVRANVIESIQTEVASGNNILNPNGKINADKIYDNVLKKKNKIVHELTSERNENKKVRDLENEKNNDKEKDNEVSQKEIIKKRISDLGIEINEIEQQELEGMIFTAEQVKADLEALAENENLTVEEAIQKYMQGKTPQEIKKIKACMEKLAILEIVEKERINRQSKGQSEDEEKRNNDGILTIDSEGKVLQDNRLLPEQSTVEAIGLSLLTSSTEENSNGRECEISPQQYIKENGGTSKAVSLLRGFENLLAATYSNDVGEENVEVQIPDFWDSSRIEEFGASHNENVNVILEYSMDAFFAKNAEEMEVYTDSDKTYNSSAAETIKNFDTSTTQVQKFVKTDFIPIMKNHGVTTTEKDQQIPELYNANKKIVQKLGEQGNENVNVNNIDEEEK